MSVLVDSHSSWMSPYAHYPEPSFVKPRNDIELSRDMLISVLTHLSTLVQREFGGNPIRLICHGGAVMLLHRDLNKLAEQKAALNGGNINGIPLRTTTRDVDYIHRSFVTECAALGFPDAGERLQRCIRATAVHFRLGGDWMNSDADIALPMAADPTGKPYDPVYAASVQPNNILAHTVFTSPNSMLTLIAVAPFWSIALKLVRYNRRDAGDISLLLQVGTSIRGIQWTNKLVEDWLLQTCWPMGYAAYPPDKITETRARISHALSGLTPSLTSPPVVPSHMWDPTGSRSPPPANAAGGWTRPSPDQNLTRSPPVWPSTQPGLSVLASPNHYQEPRNHVEAFDQSLNAFLGSQTYRPNVNTNEFDGEYYVAKGRATKPKKDKRHEKKEKTAKKKDKGLNKVKARRAKWMLSWREPDDSDEYSDSDLYSDDEESEGWESESWTMISSQRSSPVSYGPFPPPPLQVETPPIIFNQLPEGSLRRPRQFASDHLQRPYER